MKEGERFQRAFEDAAIGIALLAVEPLGKYLEVNPTFCRMTGYSRKELLSRDFQSITAARDIDRNLDQLQMLVRGSLPSLQLEKQYLRKDASPFWARLNVSMVRDDRDHPLYFIVQIEDIDERKRAEEALRDSGQLNEQVIRSAREGIVVHDRDLRYRAWNPYMEEMTGLRAEMVLGKHPLELVAAQREHGKHLLTREQVQEILDGLARAMTGETVTRVDLAVTLKHTGQTSWNSVRYDPLRNAQGEIVGVIVTVRDITEPKRAEEALRQNENRLQEAVQVSQTGIFDHDHLTDAIYWSPEQRKIYGFGPDEPVTLAGFLDCVHPEDRERIGAAVRRAHDPAGDGRFDVEHRILRRDGAVRWLTTRSQTFFKGEGGARRPVRTIGAVLDITERRRAEEALRDSSQFNQQVIANAREGIIVYDRELRYIVWNPFMEELSGVRAEDILGKRPRDLPDILLEKHGKHLIEKKTMESIETSIERAKTGETFTYFDVPFLILKTGMTGWSSVRYGPFRNAQGEIVGVIATVRDITEQKRLEEQLRHAQKLEAVGQLAGGVAHEFNNMLTAIIGNLELAIDEVPRESEQHPLLTAALQAGRRASMLTQQLLTFSHRSPVNPQPQDLGTVANDVARLLRQTIDRRIQVTVQTAEDIWKVLADAGQMNQVVMNLGVNARDSLIDCLNGTSGEPVPPGWEPRIVMAAENVRIDEAYCKLHLDARPGEFVCFSVKDNGYGIEPTVVHRIFEPFFTTKEVGRGTGLGLATVYAIIKQHEGWIDVSSVTYVETAFKFYLPRTRRTAGTTPLPAWPKEGTGHGTETVLFVDDEAPIRRLGQTILEHKGFTVLLAKDGEEAIDVFRRERGRIKLVVLDLTMPRVSGQEVLKQLLRLDPTMRFLISSGHQTPVASSELLQRGLIDLIPKPYNPEELARSVRKLLDAPVSP
ncbi:MAG TPA: PAS domain S-box protein [Nitrospiria bacterium]|jgi:PAS domain S-box-containing protein|nr:PAS domain S-box protein [Nitrospiria bacterium]